jgi:DNA-binding GntR family transcriptional regulator
MSDKQISVVLPKTISETIYEHLKSAIVRGDLKPGQRIQEKDVSSLFQVSATPVREAFFRLAAERFLAISARREVLVQGASMEEVWALYEVVGALDRHVLIKLAGAMTPARISELRKMTRKLGRFYADGDHQSYFDQNLKIHDWLWRSCENKALYETLSSLMEKIAIYRQHARFVPFADRKNLDKSYEEHVLILKAIENGDRDTLDAVIAVHWGKEFTGTCRDASNALPACPDADKPRGGGHTDKK